MNEDDLREELEEVRRENEELRDKYLRAAAAADNAAKDAERHAATRQRLLLRGLYQRLLEVVDNLERALSYAGPDDPLAKGVQATLDHLLELLRREGVEPMAVVPGELFDPGSHEAVETHEGEVEDLTIAEVRQPGYRYQGQVLRPARVVVTRPAGARADASAQP